MDRVHVLSAMWYGVRIPSPTTLGVFSTKEKAEEFRESFKARDTGHAQYGDYHIFEERLDPDPKTAVM